jgi:hypothetical protein
MLASSGPRTTNDIMAGCAKATDTRSENGADARASMVLICSNTLYVDPGRRLMALVALVYPSIATVRHALRDHPKVTHVVARRRLVTLRAVPRRLRWVPETR